MADSSERDKHFTLPSNPLCPLKKHVNSGTITHQNFSSLTNPKFFSPILTSRIESMAFNIPTSAHATGPHLLPALLCFHGGGSNQTVFKMQMRFLTWNLQQYFRLVFAQAPVESDCHVPTFESCAPFYTWVTMPYKPNNIGVINTSQRNVETVDDIILKLMEANGGVDSFVGCVGWCQGAKLASGLLTRQKMEERDSGSSRFNFKFGVLIGSSYPPFALSPGVEVKDFEILRKLPTVHAWGRDDDISDACKRMAAVCEGDECFQMEYVGSHHLPATEVESRDLCDLVLAAWYAAGGNYSLHH